MGDLWAKHKQAHELIALLEREQGKLKAEARKAVDERDSLARRLAARYEEAEKLRAEREMLEGRVDLVTLDLQRQLKLVGLYREHGKQWRALVLDLAHVVERAQPRLQDLSAASLALQEGEVLYDPQPAREAGLEHMPTEGITFAFTQHGQPYPTGTYPKETTFPPGMVAGSRGEEHLRKVKGYPSYREEQLEQVPYHVPEGYGHLEAEHELRERRPRLEDHPDARN